MSVALENRLRKMFPVLDFIKLDDWSRRGSV